MRRRIEHHGVDDEQKEAERQQRDRQRQQHQHRPQQRVEQSEHQRSDHRRAEAAHFDTRVQVRHQQQCRGQQHPADDEFQHRASIARERTVMSGSDKSVLHL